VIFRENDMKKLLMMLAAVALLAGCNTFQGVGKDMRKAGEKIENAARK
jgi:entericidin A